MENGKNKEEQAAKSAKKQQKGTIILTEQEIETIYESDENSETGTYELTKEEIATVYDAAYNGTSRDDIRILIDKKSNEVGRTFSKVFTKGRVSGELELKKLYFDKARKGNLQKAPKIFKGYDY